jgi:hypothetical protein
MPTLASQLVQFLMSLFNNPHAAQAFLADPEQALSDAGLGDVSAVDVHAAMPVVLDYAPITVNASSFDREYNMGGNSAWTGHNGGSGDLDDHAQAVQQLQHVVNDYSYASTVDDRGTVTDQSAIHNIWAADDVRQFFDSDANIGTPDVDVDVDPSFNTDNSMDDSFNTDLDLDVAGSFNDNSDNSVDIDAELENVGNTDNSIDNSVKVDAELENVGNTDNPVDVDAQLEDFANTYTDESVTGGDIPDNVVAVDNEVVAVDNEVEF